MLEVNKNTPFVVNRRMNIINSLVVAGFTFLMLIGIRPFGIYELDMAAAWKPLYIAGYAVITFLGFLLAKYLISSFPSFKPGEWTMGKEITGVLIIIFILTICFWQYWSLFSDLYPRNYTFGNWIVYSLLMTIFIGPASSGVNIYIVMNQYAEEYADLLSQSIQNDKNKQNSHHQKQIEIPSATREENLMLTEDDLLCIRADNVYAEVYYQAEEGIQKKLVRNSLNSLEKELRNDTIKRCHRSYIVNLNKVKQVSGNSRGFFLDVGISDFQIPVSRSFPREIIERNKGRISKAG